MTHASKKTTIFILIAIFVVTMCFSILAFSKNLYADTGYGEGYQEVWVNGTDSCYDTPGYWSDEGTYTWTDPNVWGETDWYVEQTIFEDNYFEYYEENYYWWYDTDCCPGDSYYDEWDNIWGESGDNCCVYDVTIRNAGWEEFNCPVPNGATANGAPVRTHDMVVWQINIVEMSPSVFEFIFLYEYKNNNWIRIYDMEGNLVYQVDFPYGKPTVIVDLPDGMYNVEIFHEEGKILQEFVIGK